MLLWLQGFTQHSDHSSVDMLIHLAEEVLLAIKQEGVLKKLKLTNSIATTNMHVFDASGVIKKYDTPEQSSYFFSFLKTIYLSLY